MKQLLLDIQPAPLPTLENFVPGGNGELVQALKTLVESAASQRALMIWGEAGSGKTHLLKAAVAHAAKRGQQATYLDTPTAALLDQQQAELVAIDGVHQLDETAQIALFNLFNRFREQGKALLVAGAVAPAQLDLRDDLKTRLAWGLVYQAVCLTDAEKAQALQRHASERGMRLPEDVVEYCLRHLRRDLPTLIATLDALDDWSLTTQKPVTVAMVRQMVQIPLSI